MSKNRREMVRIDLCECTVHISIPVYLVTAIFSLYIQVFIIHTILSDLKWTDVPSLATQLLPIRDCSSHSPSAICRDVRTSSSPPSPHSLTSPPSSSLPFCLPNHFSLSFSFFFFSPFPPSFLSLSLSHQLEILCLQLF